MAVSRDFLLMVLALFLSGAPETDGCLTVVGKAARKFADLRQYVQVHIVISVVKTLCSRLVIIEPFNNRLSFVFRDCHNLDVQGGAAAYGKGRQGRQLTSLMLDRKWCKIVNRCKKC